MTEYKIIDLDTYKRKNILEYFLSLNSPQTGFTVDVDVTDLIGFCKENHYSFFLTFMHIVALSADSVPQFRYRLHRLTVEEKKDPRHSKCPGKGPFKDLEIRVYEKCPTSNTEQADSETYCYCYLDHHMPWKAYIETATKMQRKARIDASLSSGPEPLEVYYLLSCVPWVHYTNCIHPWGDQFDSNPRIGWGKYESDFRGRMMMPVTVQVHHGLADGQHMAQFYKKVDENIKKLTEGHDPYEPLSGDPADNVSSEKMLIRQCKTEDAIILHEELGCNPEMWRYTGWNPYSSLDAAKDFLSNVIAANEVYSWVIEEDGCIIGTIGAYDYCSQDESIEIGYSIFQKWWGKGCATKAIQLACDQLSKAHAVKRIKAWCADENIASAKALERNGFVRKAIIESAINVCGETYDKVIYEKVMIR